MKFTIGKEHKYRAENVFRPQPMRSLQILRDRLLILSFYRTAAALNIFDLDQADVGAHERMVRLPTGVIAFQSSHDDCHSLKLVLYKELGVMCQRLDQSRENLVFSLHHEGDGGKEKNGGKGIISGMKKYKLKFPL